MLNLHNTALDLLNEGSLAVGVGLRQARTVDIARAMRTAGFDWLFIDMEHNSMDLDMAVQISVAAQDAGITPIVRVPGFQHFHATRALDGGAQGIVFPHVDDAETAVELVANCRYAPDGHRSIYGTLPQLNFEPHPPAEAAAAINATTLIMVMLETPTAIANADEIAAVPGIDVVMIGTSDLTMEMGIPGQLKHPDVVAAYRSLTEACKKHGKHAGMGGVYDAAVMSDYVDMGVRLILATSDLSLLLSAGKAQAAAVRGLL